MPYCDLFGTGVLEIFFGVTSTVYSSPRNNRLKDPYNIPSFCLHIDHWCDYMEDCEDGSDELTCSSGRCKFTYSELCMILEITRCYDVYCGKYVHVCKLKIAL